MTIELTPEQLADLRVSVKAHKEELQIAVRFLMPEAFQNTEDRKTRAEAKRIESLHDLLTHSTAVLLSRP